MSKKREKADTEPQFPYTVSPGALRKLLKEIPNRPKPGKLTLNSLKTWNVTSSNDASPIRVLRELGMVGGSGEPLQPYIDFMQPAPGGPNALGSLIKEKYKGLFEASHEPHKDNEALRKFFNIHAGGSAQTINLQLQTFKALSEHAAFMGSMNTMSGSVSDPGSRAARSADHSDAGDVLSLPPVKIDLHIHLPENKMVRDYEAIIQDIAKYIYGRSEIARG
jgi:Family of unknown function (DUF5343)